MPSTRGKEKNVGGVGMGFFPPSGHLRKTMKAFSSVVLGAVILGKSVEAFSPSARSKVLNDLKDMRMDVKDMRMDMKDVRMSGAGGAASPDYYVEGKWKTLMTVLMSVISGFVLRNFIMLAVLISLPLGIE